jgi:hypothetical protein
MNSIKNYAYLKRPLMVICFKNSDERYNLHYYTNNYDRKRIPASTLEWADYSDEKRVFW